MLSSVPQGTVLGPILFIILINNISGGILSKLSTFADDTRITRGILDINDTLLLQKDLQTVYQWQEENNMKFNEGTFELLRYGDDRDLKEQTNYTGPEGQVITEKDNVRDLGVLMTNNATFINHINKAVITAKQKCGWIMRTFRSREPTVMRTLWNSLVQPHLDYCSQLWMPTKRGELQRLEQVQRRFTLAVLGTQDKNYWERLKLLGMRSQQRRMERYRIIYSWKIITNKVPNPGITTRDSNRRGIVCIIPPIINQAPARIKTIKDNSFLVQGPRLFNTLPRDIRAMHDCTTNQFKNHLDCYLRNLPDEPPLPGYTHRNHSNSSTMPNNMQL